MNAMIGYVTSKYVPAAACVVLAACSAETFAPTVADGGGALDAAADAADAAADGDATAPEHGDSASPDAPVPEDATRDAGAPLAGIAVVLPKSIGFNGDVLEAFI